jgi:hypothetical protein
VPHAGQAISPTARPFGIRPASQSRTVERGMPVSREIASGNFPRAARSTTVFTCSGVRISSEHMFARAPDATSGAAHLRTRYIGGPTRLWWNW